MQKNFAYRDLTEYDFSDADLRGADFSHAILRQADFRRARLEQADVSYADLEGAHFVEDFYLKASALSPDGTLLATDLHDHKHHDDGIRLWNVASGQIERERIGHLLSVTCLDFHPRGHLLAGGNAGGLIRLWDVEQGQLVREMQTSPAYSVRSLAFHPNGKWLIAGNKSISVLAGQQPVIHILDIEKGELVGRFPGGVHTLACQGTGELLARTDGGRTIEVWEFARWRYISTVSVPHFVHGQITSLAFHPTQSTWLYVHLRAEQFSTIILLDLASGTMLSSLRGSAKGAQPGESAIEPSRMVPLAQENQLAVVGWGNTSAHVEIWDFLKKERLRSFQNCGGHKAGFFVDEVESKLVVVAHSGAFTVIDLQTGGQQHQQPTLPACAGMNICGVTGLSERERSTLLQHGAIEVEPAGRGQAQSATQPSLVAEPKAARVVLHKVITSENAKQSEAQQSFEVKLLPDGRLSFFEDYQSASVYVDTFQHYWLTIPSNAVTDVLALLAGQSHLPFPTSQTNQPDTFLQQALQALIDQGVFFSSPSRADAQESAGQAIILLEQWLEQAHIPHRRATSRTAFTVYDDVGPLTW